MAYVQNTTADISIPQRLRAGFAHLKTAWLQGREYKRTYNELNRLTNRELADIGVRRCDIADIARKHVYHV